MAGHVAERMDETIAADGEMPEDRDLSFPLFKESLAYQAQLFARTAQSDYMGRIAATGIAPAQAYVLGELWFNEPLSQVDLARRLEIGKATVGQTLTRLERAGFIERRRAASDRRVVMVHLTEEGRKLRAPLRDGAVALNEMLERLLGKECVDSLTERLQFANRQFAGLAEPVEN